MKFININPEFTFMRFARFLSILLFLVFLPVLRAQETHGPGSESSPVYTDFQKRDYRFYPGGKIGISLEVPGDLKIIGWDRGSVLVEAEITVRSLPEEKARTLLEKSSIPRVRYTNSDSTIQVSELPGLKGLLEVNLTVYVPTAKTDLTMQLRSGNFVIDKVNGWIETTLAEGNMRLTDIDGYFSGKTRKGNISVSLSGNRLSGQGFTAITDEGRVDLILPEKYSAMLQLDTRNGEITVDYPAQEVEGELIPIEVATQKKTQQLRARVGDGGAPLRLGTLSGDVSLSKK